MPRARMIKPEFYDDEKLASVSRDARLTFTGLWVQSDDYAVVKGNHKWLMAKIFPYDDINLKTFSGWLKELESIDCIRPFTVNGENFYYIRTFSDHQTINKPSQTRNPTPPDEVLHNSYTTTTLLPSETEVVKQKSKYKEKPKRKTPLPENFSISDSVRQWAKENGHHNLEAHLEPFKNKCLAKGYEYIDWDRAFMEAVRENWGKIGNGNSNNLKPQSDLPPHIAAKIVRY